MAKKGQIPYGDAMSAIGVQKVWAGAPTILWIAQGGKGFPASHKCRIPLSVNDVVQEGYFVDIFHKKSDLEGVPDKISLTLVVRGARILALDENGPSEHINTVGKGYPYFGMNADHPHLHYPVPDCCSGYAEPIDRDGHEALWRIFLERANISGAPSFNLPPRKPQPESGQLELL